MFLVTNFFSVFIPFWGMLGLWTTRIGYHHRVSRFDTQARLIKSTNLPLTKYALNSGSSTSITLFLVSFKHHTTPYVRHFFESSEVLIIVIQNSTPKQ